jgi:hypothetical protein
MQSDDVPIITEEVFLILKPYLPAGTYMSSAFRDAAYQLRVIQQKAEAWNREHPNDRIPLPAMHLKMPQTWAPTLIALRKRIKINAPYTVVYDKIKLPVTPHSNMRAVFDLSHPSQTVPKIHDILHCCVAAGKRGLIEYNQLKPETEGGQLAVHVDVKTVSSRALQQLWEQMGFAVA